MICKDIYIYIYINCAVGFERNDVKLLPALFDSKFPICSFFVSFFFFSWYSLLPSVIFRYDELIKSYKIKSQGDQVTLR